MKNKNIYRLLCLFLLISILFQFSSCRRKQEQVVEEVRSLNAIITFISGDAYIFSERGIFPAVIGNTLGEGDSVRTAADSYIEILIAGNSVIRMDENTELSMDRLAAVGANSNVAMSLVTGTIINKVERIAGTESYVVRTRSSAFGVRGTEFMVSCFGSDEVLLAVKSGRVQMVPYLDVIERLKENAPPGERVENFIRLVEEGFPVLSGGSEITVTPGLSAEILSILSTVENAFSNLRLGRITINNLYEIISNSSSAVMSEVENSLTLVQNISGANLDKLRITDFMQIYGPDERFREIAFRTEPAGARIYFDNSFIGFGSVSALMPENRRIRVAVEEEGYESFEREFVVSEITERPHIITLRPMAPARGFFEISVLPNDAGIYIEDRFVARGRFSGTYAPGTRLNVSVQRREYRTENLFVEIIEGETLRRNITLPVLLMPYTFDTGFSRLDTITSTGRNYYAFASAGNGFSVLSSEGRALFRSNDANAATPVFAGGRLLFVSGNTFRAIDTVNWVEAGNIELEEAPYRTPVVSGNSVLINSGDSILVIDSNDFRVNRRIRVPDIVVSYPYFSNNRIITVTDKGVAQIFGQDETPLSSISVALGNPSGMSIATSNNFGYFANVDGTINAIDLQTGNFLWAGRFQPDVSGRLPQISATGNVIIVYSNNTLKFFRPNGEEIREIGQVTSFYHGEDSLVYAVLGNRRITVYNPVTGAVVRSADIGISLESIVFNNGRIHAAAENGQYVVINPAAF